MRIYYLAFTEGSYFYGQNKLLVFLLLISPKIGEGHWKFIGVAAWYGICVGQRTILR